MHLPITALDTVLVNERRIILVGQGPYLRLYDGLSNRLLGSRRLFDVQPVHHIAHQIAVTGPTVVAVGGRHVAKVILERSDDGDVIISHVSVKFINAKEWVLKVHQHGDGFLCLTTNNVLFSLDSGGRQSDGVTVGKLAQGPDASLYSGDFCSIGATKVLVAAGSVFGEVLVWTCENIGASQTEWIAATTHRFEGHTGSVFGVRISPEYNWAGRPARFVLSCSDDRTVQMWDISDYAHPSNHVVRDEVVDTGFGQDSTDSGHRVAMGWGHQSRIWDVDFINFLGAGSEGGQLQIATRGEDGTSQYWSVQLPHQEAEGPAKGKLLSYASDRYHSGKNVWAWTKYCFKETLHVVTGGADGRVVSRVVTLIGNCRKGVVEYSTPFKQIPITPSPQSLKEYTILDGDAGQEVLAVTTNGEIVRYSPQPNGEHQWTVLAGLSSHRVTKLCDDTPFGMIIAATTDGILLKNDRGLPRMLSSGPLVGQVGAIQVAGSEIHSKTFRLCLIVTSMTGTASVIWVNLEDENVTSSDQLLQLPDHFLVTSSCYDYSRKALVLGSRAGAVAVYSSLSEMTHPSAESLCVRHVHGNDAVTSLQVLDFDTSDYFDGRYLLSTGRDGRYAIHRIETASPHAKLRFHTTHRAAPPFGPHVEGADILFSPDGRMKELLLYGFRSKDFVAWNETRQTEVFSVDCGGAHRSWAYRSHIADSGSGSSFVWTKAGNFQLYSEDASAHHILQTGGHGREIKALAICPRTYSSKERNMTDAPLFATGAEDTTIRIFGIGQSFSANNQGSSLIQLCTMNDHTAGLQDVAFSSCGNFLFSCGGAEQLFAWSLSYGVPLVGVGSVLQDKMPQTDDDSDVRIMSISVNEDASGRPRNFILAAAYSNGKIKVMTYSADEVAGKGTWHTNRQIPFGSFCLMQVFMPKAPFCANERAPILSAGTNGFINLTSFDETDGHSMGLHSVHQSSVLTMDAVDLGAGVFFIATGGDDNALGLTVLNTSAPTNNKSTAARFSTVVIRDAHAAALTATTLLSASKVSTGLRIALATAGNDQKVNVWEVMIPIESMTSADSFKVTKLRACWTAVADVSNIDLVGTRLLVTGVGIEVLNLETKRLLDEANKELPA